MPPSDIPLNQQEWDDTFGEGGVPFFALRFPLPEGESADTGWTLPVSCGQHAPAFSLYDTSSGAAVYSTTLDYRNEYIQLLLGYLTGDGDGGWCALGLPDGETFDLPEKIDLPASSWEIGLSMTLSLGASRTRPATLRPRFTLASRATAWPRAASTGSSVARHRPAYRDNPGSGRYTALA